MQMSSNKKGFIGDFKLEVVSERIDKNPNENLVKSQLKWDVNPIFEHFSSWDDAKIKIYLRSYQQNWFLAQFPNARKE